MTKLVCIVCPKGCTLSVEDAPGFAVSGHGCERGAVYGKEEVMHPVRVLTATVCIEGALHRRCPVKLTKAIDKGLLRKAAAELHALCLKAPVCSGDIVLEDVLGTGANCVTTRSMERVVPAAITGEDS